jgi:hypothetical protein
LLTTSYWITAPTTYPTRLLICDIAFRKPRVAFSRVYFLLSPSFPFKDLSNPCRDPEQSPEHLLNPEESQWMTLATHRLRRKTRMFDLNLHSYVLVRGVTTYAHSDRNVRLQILENASATQTESMKVNAAGENCIQNARTVHISHYHNASLRHLLSTADF